MANCPEEVKNDEEFTCAMKLGNASVMPMVMQAVVDLGVLDIISKATAFEEKGGISAEEIASHQELSADTTPAKASSMLDRMLYLLASHSILICTISTTNNNNNRRMRLKSLSPVARYFVPNSDGISFGPLMSLVHDKVYRVCWPELKAAVLEGSIPFERVHDMHTFEYLGKDPMFNDVFNKAMISSTTIVVGKILDSYKGFDQLHQVVDVGGGLGVTLNLITSKYPHIKGINFDLQHVVQHAPYYPGVENVAGDIFESVPSGDAIYMQAVLHDWTDEQCVKLLKNCYKALPEKGKVNVVERLLPEVPDATPTTQEICQTDLIMMTQNPGGRERNESEFLSLATAAGFAGIRFQCSVSVYWVIELYK